MFPYVKRYSNGSELEGPLQQDDLESTEVEKRMRICSGKYFGLYTRFGSNEECVIDGEVKTYLNQMIQENDVQNVASLIQKNMKKNTPQRWDTWLDRLGLDVDEIPGNSKNLLLCALFNIYYKNSDRISRQKSLTLHRAKYIIFDLLLKATEDQFNVFMEEINEEYKYLAFFEESSLYFQNNLKRISYPELQYHIMEMRQSKLEEAYRCMCNTILTQGINLYEDYYREHNFWVLWRFCYNENRFPELKEYIKEVLSEKNIYRFLWDIVRYDDKKYYIPQNWMNIFIKDEELDCIDSLIEKHQPSKLSELFVKEIYDHYRNRITEEDSYVFRDSLEQVVL